MTKDEHFYTVGQLRERLEGLDDDRPIYCQVVAENGDAWTMFAYFDGEGPEGFGSAVLQFKHPDLDALHEYPQWREQ